MAAQDIVNKFKQSNEDSWQYRKFIPNPDTLAKIDELIEADKTEEAARMISWYIPSEETLAVMNGDTPDTTPDTTDDEPTTGDETNEPEVPAGDEPTTGDETNEPEPDKNGADGDQNPTDQLIGDQADTETPAGDGDVLTDPETENQNNLEGTDDGE